MVLGRPGFDRVSAMLKLSGKDDWAIFVGQWPPTFLLFGLYHRVVRPSRR